MSLRLWLPLNGDLINRGLEPSITTTNNLNLVTFVDNGKLGGKCALFDLTNKACFLQTNYYTNFGVDDFSIAFWIKLDSSVSENESSWLYLISSKGYGANYAGLAVIYSKNSGKIGLRTSTGSAQSWVDCSELFSDYLDKWTHIIAVRNHLDSKHGYFYINGIKYELESSLPLRDIGNMALRIGTDKNSNSAYTLKDGYYFPAPMQMQDVRIYDHALSDKEAKELAKGLVLHYKLDDEEFLTEETYNYMSAEQSIPGFRTKVINDVSTTGKYWSPISIDGIDIYTFSVYINNNTNKGLRVILRAQTSSKSDVGDYKLGNIIAAGQSGWSVVTLDLSTITNAGGVSIKTGMWADDGTIGTVTPNPTMGYMQLEKKDHRTAWTLGGTTRAATTEIKDVSGYNHNATIIGSPIAQYDSKRYNNCIHFELGQYIKTNEIVSTFMPVEELSVNAWINYSTSGAILSCTLSGGFNFYPTLFSVYIGSSLKKATITTAPSNEWHMLTGVFNGLTATLYIDKELVGLASAVGIIKYVNNRLIISGEANGSSGVENSNFVGDISDVRIYATALSDNDIKELYETSASIDNKSNIYSRQFEETNLNKISITNRGQLQMDAIEENSSTASFYKDTKDVKGLLIYEY